MIRVIQLARAVIPLREIHLGEKSRTTNRMFSMNQSKRIFISRKIPPRGKSWIAWNLAGRFGNMFPIGKMSHFLGRSRLACSSTALNRTLDPRNRLFDHFMPFP